jgi:hypothetical protein
MHKTLARVVNNYALAVVNFMIDENNRIPAVCISRTANHPFLTKPRDTMLSVRSAPLTP